MNDQRYLVLTHTWNEWNHQPSKYTLLGLADSDEAGRKMVADHAAETGTPADHRYYSISVARYPDPEAMARDIVATAVRHGQTYDDLIKGQGGTASIGYESNIGGYLFRPDAVAGTKLQAHEMYCRVGHEWRVFDLRVLFAEEHSGMRQGALI